MFRATTECHLNVLWDVFIGDLYNGKSMFIHLMRNYKEVKGLASQEKHWNW